jgi:hypothetical protein
LHEPHAKLAKSPERCFLRDLAELNLASKLFREPIDFLFAFGNGGMQERTLRYSD